VDSFFVPPPTAAIWGVGALVLGLVVWALLQRLLRLALALGLGLACLYAVFFLTGTEPPRALEEARRDVEDGLAEGARRGAEAATDGVRDLGGNLRDAATRALRETAEEDARDPARSR